jgi:hypothetical protein
LLAKEQELVAKKAELEEVKKERDSVRGRRFEYIQILHLKL